MKYRRVENIDLSEVSLDCSWAVDKSAQDAKALVRRALDVGVDFFSTLEPAEATALGESLSQLGARRKAVVSAGIPDFFAAYASHHMTAAQFLEHELADRQQRLGGNYIDCFVLDLGGGRSVDLDGVLKEEIQPGAPGRGVAAQGFEGGIFLHETLADSLAVLAGFKQEGRIRLSAVSGENVAAVKRILVKHASIDLAFVPYNYAFRAAASELLAIAAEVKTAIIATRPLWWGIREIPVTVLAESPYPPDSASIAVPAGQLATSACKWPLSEPVVASVLAGARSPEEIASAAGASGDIHWTKKDEEVLRGVAAVATAQHGIFLVLSAMNSPDPAMRARGWAACLRLGLADFCYDPAAGDAPRADALRRIAEAAVQTPPPAAEDLDELV
jgi:aryl-alcohol dehydrogenase-like predicted oxidoreductase